jgi:hypothetical protein
VAVVENSDPPPLVADSVAPQDFAAVLTSWEGPVRDAAELPPSVSRGFFEPALPR